jgi:protein-S-isoprenylcysteine O-methyltransferase Ste14
VASGREDATVHALVSGAAGTTAPWQFTIFALVWGAGILFVLVQVATHPALLLRRLRGGPAAEPDAIQRLISPLFTLGAVALFALSVLDGLRRWSQVPVPVVVLGDVLVGTGLVLLTFVFRVNQFAAAAVRVEPGQPVISTGPYAVVRHPLYSPGLLVFLGAPVALGSWWGLALFPPLLVLTLLRLLNEERYLSEHLPGYQEYCTNVRHRLIPAMW